MNTLPTTNSLLCRSCVHPHTQPPADDCARWDFHHSAYCLSLTPRWKVFERRYWKRLMRHPA